MAPKSKRTLGREHSDDSDVIFVPSSEAVAHTRRPAPLLHFYCYEISNSLSCGLLTSTPQIEQLETWR